MGRWGGCLACGAEAAPGKRYCGDCGAPLPVTCPACGELAEPGKRFCGDCGAPLNADAAGLGPPGAEIAVPGRAGPQPPRSERSGPVPPRTERSGPVPPGAEQPRPERRQVSVLFCDLVGFTPLAEHRDPEDVRELLSGYFALAKTIVARHGGVIEKFIGDAVMAVWGAPVALEDDAERAVRAGLELVSAIPAYGSAGGVELAARVGVATGNAATVETPGEGLVTGDRVNVAARIQATAPSGSCYVDAATRRLSASAIAFDDAGSHALKGKTEPERLFAAVRVLSGVGGRQRTEGPEAPLIGRDAELRALKDLFHLTVERSSPRLAVVCGPAGVGKSRLGWEFEKYVDGIAETVLWHRGRCLSYGEGVAFWPLAEIVRQRLGIAEDDPVEVTRAKLDEGVARFIPEHERDYVAARLARLLAAERPGERGKTLAREELFAGWRLFFERLAAVAPVVLLIENAQHADDSLLDFIDHLIDWISDLPVFVLVLARPELYDARPGFGAGRGRSTFSLDPLDPVSMDQLIDELVPDMPGSARQVITSRAQGIPLFAVEMVLSLVDAGGVVMTGQYRLDGELGQLTVPDSLHALLAARLDALGDPARRLVGVASVLGSSFSAEALIAVSGREASEVRASLDELVRRSVLQVSADPLSPQRGDYRFCQELLRQVAYETLSRRDRKARHLAVAAQLRRTHANDGEEIAELIARHYLDALGAEPDDPDVPATREQALSMLVRAAERAERVGAPGRAAASFADAAELAASGYGAGAAGSAGGPGEGPPLAATLWERAAGADFVAGEHDRAVEHADAARRCYLELGDVRSAARTETVAGRALLQDGRHAEARERLARALGGLRGQPDADTANALGVLANLELFDGNLPEGERLAAEALAMGQVLEVGPGLLAYLFLTQGSAQSYANRTEEAATSYREAARLAERAGEVLRLCTALGNLSDALSGIDPADAADAARAAIEQARRIGARHYLGGSTWNLSSSLLELGEWDQVETVLEATTAAEDLGGDEDIRWTQAWLAALRGDGEQAAAILASLKSLRTTERVDDRAYAALLEAFIAFALGRPADALARARSVLSHAAAIGVGREQVRWAWPLAARLAAELGETATLAELFTLLDAQPAGQLSPLLQAEDDLARARAAADAADLHAGSAFTEAVAALRDTASPYRLAWGLIDHAAFLARSGPAAPARAAAVEARAIAIRLRCQPLLRRADALIGPPAGVSAGVTRP
jgi:class 3 adenylate cyclase/tetratricopeptide (TPR) repeat protein